MNVVRTGESFVSVVIPTYNCALFLERAIRSAIGQSYQHREIIVVDDGSTDDTAAVATRFAEQIIYIRQENRGVAAARNVAVVRARGKYLAFLDADDCWHPHKLAVQVGVLDRFKGVDLVFSDFTIIDENDTVLGRCQVETHYTVFTRNGFSLRSIFTKHRKLAGDFNRGATRRETEIFLGMVFPALFLGNFVNTSTVVMRRGAFFQAGGFDERRRTQEDYELWLKVAASAAVGYVDDELVDTRKRAGQLTEVETHHRINMDVLRVLESRSANAYEQLDKRDVRKRLAHVRCQVALAKMGIGDRIGARTILKQSIRDKTLTPMVLLLCLWNYVPGPISRWLVACRRKLRTILNSR
ncbi:glycosyltransferase [bacterium]|nr:glycosyltransferase [bacterium]